VPGAGCTGRLLHIHHVWHWEDGGPTDTANLIAICAAHHRLHHRGELGIEATDADRSDGIVFTTPLGCPLDSAIRPVPPPPGATGPPVAPYEHPLGERLQANWVAFAPPSPN
jgi:hypothetical protein